MVGLVDKMNAKTNNDIISLIKDINIVTHRYIDSKYVPNDLSFYTLQDIISLETEILCFFANITSDNFAEPNNNDYFELRNKIKKLSSLINNLFLELP